MFRLTMRIFKTLFAVVFFLSISVSTVFAYNTEYVCKSEIASGFIYSSVVKKWNGVHFEANAKYVIRGARDDDFETELGKKYKGAKLVVYSVKGGQSLPPKLFCTGYDVHGFTHCEGLSETLRFNNQSMRFLSVFSSGYVLSGEALQRGLDGAETPMLVIGKCKTL